MGSGTAQLRFEISLFEPNFYQDVTVYLSGFYRSRVFSSGNIRYIFFNMNAKKKAKCMQSNDKRISAAQIRVIGKIRLGAEIDS